MAILTEADRKAGFKLYEIPTVLTVAGKNPEHAIKNLHDLMGGDGRLYDIYGFVTNGPVCEADNQ